LLAGGVFNIAMGLIFFSNQLLDFFFNSAMWLEEMLFKSAALLPYPQNPVHLLLIHGFGAGVLILGVTLIHSAKETVRFLPFIFYDSLGRLLFGILMVFYVIRYSLMYTILAFAVIELTFAIVYLIICWKLAEP
jgi:hypothetical protein